VDVVPDPVELWFCPPSAKSRPEEITRASMMVNNVFIAFTPSLYGVPETASSLILIYAIISGLSTVVMVLSWYERFGFQKVTEKLKIFRSGHQWPSRGI
jgi:hypothetical protein